MVEGSAYPRVLVVTMGRINASDSYNNAMLLRNTFGDWPRENTAQIYSSGSTEDNGFFGQYYKLGPEDRRFGKLFYRLKGDVQSETAKDTEASLSTAGRRPTLLSLAQRYVIETGLYELLFKPRISKRMKAWVEAFKPDIVLAQGYNLTFSILPVLLKQFTSSKMAYYSSDDWPTYLYSGSMGEPRLFRWLVRPAVKRAVDRLLQETDIPFAFGQGMAEEYATRFRKNFTVLYHADDPERFANANPVRIHPVGVRTILAAGTFDQYRWPLLMDVDACCRILREEGCPVRLAVVSSAIDPAGRAVLERASYVDLVPDPGHDLLPCYLKGADLLLISETFDAGVVSAIRLSISSKAHLFMFSQRPILVYSHPDAGIAKDAALRQWGRLVSQRDQALLREAIQTLLTNQEVASSSVRQGEATSRRFHSHQVNQHLFLTRVREAVSCADRANPVAPDR